MAGPSCGTGSRWQPQTSLYNYNYGVGMNFYQPMIDYIDAKQSGRKSVYPHLPYTEERGLRDYDPLKVLKSYTDRELVTIAHRTEARARAKLRDSKALSKSTFDLSQTVEAAQISHKVQVQQRRTKKIVKQIDKVKTKMCDDFDIDYDPEENQKIAAALKSSQKFLRGKSAKAIEAQLLSESMKNINESREIDVKKFQRSKKTYNTHDYAAHLRWMNERTQEQLEDSFVVPLEALNLELKGFDKRTSQYFLEKR